MKNVNLPIFPITKAANKLPITYEHMKIVQNVPKLRLCFLSSVVQSQTYFPWPTHIIEAPNPLMMPDTTNRAYMEDLKDLLSDLTAMGMMEHITQKQ